MYIGSFLSRQHVNSSRDITVYMSLCDFIWSSWCSCRVSPSVWTRRTLFRDWCTAVERIWSEALWFLSLTLTHRSLSKSQMTALTSAILVHFITSTVRHLTLRLRTSGRVRLSGTTILTRTAFPIHCVVTRQAHICPSILLCVTPMACVFRPVRISSSVIRLPHTPGHLEALFSMMRLQWVKPRVKPHPPCLEINFRLFFFTKSFHSYLFIVLRKLAKTF